MDRTTQISDWLRARVNAAGARGLVVGLDGGLDSAVVVRLCQIASPGQTVGVILPCPGDPLDETSARAASDHFRVPSIHIDLAPVYDRLIDGLRAAIASIPPEQTPPIPSEGIDERSGALPRSVTPRLRMAALYYVANSLDYVVAGTTNRSGLTIGRFTKHGDCAVDLLPLGNLLESEVRILGAELGVPRAILDRTAASSSTGDAGAGFRDSDLERYLLRGPDGVAPALALRFERMIRASEHKRAMAPSPE